MTVLQCAEEIRHIATLRRDLECFLNEKGSFRIWSNNPGLAFSRNACPITLLVWVKRSFYGTIPDAELFLVLNKEIGLSTSDAKKIALVSDKPKDANCPASKIFLSLC